jgi:formamidopyrimidine-DNA glycosylase
MSELPDLEIFSRNLEQQLSGKLLKEVTVKNGKKLNVSVKELKAAIEDQKLVHISQSGETCTGKCSETDFKNPSRYYQW